MIRRRTIGGRSRDAAAAERIAADAWPSRRRSIQTTIQIDGRDDRDPGEHVAGLRAERAGAAHAAQRTGQAAAAAALHEHEQDQKDRQQRQEQWQRMQLMIKLITIDHKDTENKSMSH